MSNPQDPSTPHDPWGGAAQGSDPAGRPQPPAPQYPAPHYPAPQAPPPQYPEPQAQPPQYQPPDYSRPEYQPSQYGQPEYQPSQYGQPEHQPPQYGQPQYGQPQYGQPHYGQQPEWQQHQATPPVTRRRSALIAGLAAVVVVIAGAAVTYVAIGNKNSSAGAATPQSAVKSVVADLGKSDLLGILDHLPPAERPGLRDPITDEVAQLKRLQVLDPSADPNKIGGVTVATSGLTFQPQDEVVNDHVRIVKLTGGTITVSADASKVPYTQAFIKAAFHGTPPSGVSTNTIDIAKDVQDNGGPVRIATVKSGGKWYPSLMYTIADNLTHDAGLANPTAADDIPAVGAASAEAAVRALYRGRLEVRPQGRDLPAGARRTRCRARVRRADRQEQRPPRRPTSRSTRSPSPRRRSAGACGCAEASPSRPEATPPRWPSTVTASPSTRAGPARSSAPPRRSSNSPRTSTSRPRSRPL